MTDKIENLLQKYAFGTATVAEVNDLTELLKDNNHDDEVKRLLEQMAENTVPGQSYDNRRLEDIIQKILRSQDRAKVIPLNKAKLFTKVAAAAVIVLLLSIGGYLYFNNNGYFNNNASIRQAQGDTAQQKPFKKDITPGGNRAVLTLANGTQIILDSAANGTLAQQGNTKIIKLDNGQLAYDVLNKKPGEVLYNTITTPGGGQYQIVLADGSKVWLNASSSLRFPISFNGKERIVELTGEGYFEVAPLTTGIGKTRDKISFIVKIKTPIGDGSKIEVLGTHFNIMAYSDEATINTTLLEGSVKVWNGNKSGLLKPGQQAKINTVSQAISVTNADTEKAVAWKNGQFMFRRDDIKTIIRQIGRWYDVDISYSEVIPSRLYSGTISKYVNASEVFKILELGGIKFKIEGKKVIVL